ncbi:MAG: hypothetical protein JWP32_2869 [Schumannella sp.]|nr:hypothetical protein [Schumannella sp.]
MTGRKHGRATSSLLNEKPIEAWFEPRTRPERAEYREGRCNACCKTPGFGCAKNYICDCHKTGGTK